MTLLMIPGEALEDMKNGQRVAFEPGAGSTGERATTVGHPPLCFFLNGRLSGLADKMEVNALLVVSDTCINSFDLGNVCVICDFSSCAFSTAGQENRVGTVQDPFPLCPVRLKNE